jgi:membrane-associated PAP2 superfamily phosphatase
MPVLTLPARPAAVAPAREWRALGLAALLLLAWDFSGLDIVLSHWFGDASGFAWRDRWLTASLLHTGGRWVGLAMLALLVINLWRPQPFASRLDRSERAWWLLVTLACAFVIPLIKRHSLTSCPWSLAEFGGTARWVSHWAFGVADGGPGGCFPSGHASSAFALLGGYHALRGKHPRAARWWLASVLLGGVLFAGVQLVRGAHFLSHSLWTGWLCWAIAAASHHAFQGYRRRQQNAAEPQLAAAPQEQPACGRYSTSPP